MQLRSSSRHSIARAGLGALALCLSLSSGRVSAQEEFIRADANGDQIITFADSYTIFSYLFQGSGNHINCTSAFDADDNGRVNISDPIRILNHDMLGGEAPPAPHPDIGPDPTEDNLVCTDYGQTEVVTDDGSQLIIGDATLAGGDERQVTVVISGLLTSRSPTLNLTLTTSPGLLEGAALETDLAEVLVAPFFAAVTLGDSELEIGIVASFLNFASYPAGEQADLISLALCLAPGTPAGVYELGLSAGSLTDADSALEVVPTLISGELTVENDISETADDCDLPTEIAVSDNPDPPDPPDPPPGPMPEDIESVLELTSATAAPGEQLTISYNVTANAQIQGMSYSINFDENVLEAGEPTPYFLSETRPHFWVWRANNLTENPGEAGFDEGYMGGAMVFNFLTNEGIPPANTENTLVDFPFTVRPGAVSGETYVEVRDGAVIEPGAPAVVNNLTANGLAVTPDNARSMVFVDGAIGILPDISVFVRGDANENDVVTLDDAVRTLDVLFQGTDRPDCLDRLDSNDDGRVNVTDAVRTLLFLFQGGAPPPAPYPEAGVDPTEDSLPCEA